MSSIVASAPPRRRAKRRLRRVPGRPALAGRRLYQATPELLEAVLELSWTAYWQRRREFEANCSVADHPDPGLRLHAAIAGVDRNPLAGAEADLLELYRLIVRVGVERSYPGLFKLDLLGKGVTKPMIAGLSPATTFPLGAAVPLQRIWTLADKTRLRSEARILTRRVIAAADNGRTERLLGSQDFASALDRSIGRLQIGRQAAKPWALDVDAAILLPGIGLLDIVSPQPLRARKGASLLERHISRALALGRPATPIRFACAYEPAATRGRSRTIAAYVVSGRGVLAGDALFAQIFPGTAAELFSQKFARVGRMTFAD
jgi:hypothetical protein